MWFTSLLRSRFASRTAAATAASCKTSGSRSTPAGQCSQCMVSTHSVLPQYSHSAHSARSVLHQYSLSTRQYWHTYSLRQHFAPAVHPDSRASRRYRTQRHVGIGRSVMSVSDAASCRYRMQHCVGIGRSVTSVSDAASRRYRTQRRIGIGRSVASVSDAASCRYRTQRCVGIGRCVTLRLFPAVPAEIVDCPPDKWVDRGTGVRLRCAAHGHPRPGVTWYRDGTQVSARACVLYRCVCVTVCVCVCVCWEHVCMPRPR